MTKKEKKDAPGIREVGKFMYDNFKHQIKSTGMTEEEDYWTDLQLYDHKDKKYEVEVKTIFQKAYNSKYFKGDYPEGKEFYYINKEAQGKDALSKWDKLTKTNFYTFFVFNTPDEYIVYNMDMLKQASLGECELYQTHTTYFDNKQKSWEKKVMIDFDKGKRFKKNTDNNGKKEKRKRTKGTDTDTKG